MIKKLLTILLFLPLISSCQKVYINHGSGIPVNINGTGTQVTITGVQTESYPIEYKAESGDYASLITMKAGNDTVIYDYYNKDDELIATGGLSMDTDRPIAAIKTDVFTALTLSDLNDMVFAHDPNITNYVGFGNLVPLGGMDYAFSGRRGTSHLTNGHIATLPYSSLTRTFSTRVVVNPLDAGQDLRGGSSLVIGSQIYFFSSIYIPASDSFYCMMLYKSTDLTGTAWIADTLLYFPGSNGGVNEATYKRFNFYGTPLHLAGTETWYVPWYEATTAASPWRANFIKTTDNFATWTTHNISDALDRLSEFVLEYVGNNTLVAMTRQETNTPMKCNLSFDMGVTWDGWQLTNLGASLGRVMPDLILTPDHGLVCIYGDRGSNDVMMSKDNVVGNILQQPSVWNTPVPIYTEAVEPTFKPLGYPSIIRVAQSRYMISFSIEYNGGNARLFIGDGSIDNF